MNSSNEPKKLYRSRKQRVLSGVCGGLGEYFNVDPVWIRLLFILGTILGVGLFGIIYLIMIFIVPNAPNDPSCPNCK